MDTIKDVVKNGKIERRSQPAVVIENKEPPEIPEMHVGEMAANSQFTGEDSIKYLVSLALQKFKGKLTRVKEKDSVQKDSDEDVRNHLEVGETGLNVKKEDVVEDVNERTSVHQTDKVSNAKLEGDATSGGSAKQVKKKKSKKKKSKKKKASEGRKKSASKAAEAIRKAKLEELDRETRQIIREAAEALNRNQTPVLRRSSPKVYRLPQDDETTSSTRRGEETTPSTGSGINQDSLRSKEGSVDAEGMQLSGGSRSSIDGSNADSSSKSSDGSTLKDSTTSDKPRNGATVSASETADNKMGVADSDNQVGVVVNGSVAGNRRAGQQSHRTRKTREQIREEESKRRFPERQPWPTLEECEAASVPKSVVFTSTWLSVTAKGIK